MAIFNIGADITVDTIEPLCRNLCGSGKPQLPDGPLHNQDGEVIGFFYSPGCEDCVDDGNAWDLYKDLHGIKPRWMTREERIAWYRAERDAGFPTEALEW